MNFDIEYCVKAMDDAAGLASGKEEIPSVLFLLADTFLVVERARDSRKTMGKGLKEFRDIERTEAEARSKIVASSYLHGVNLAKIMSGAISYSAPPENEAVASEEQQQMSFADSSRIHVNSSSHSEIVKKFKVHVERFQGLHDPKMPTEFYTDLERWFSEHGILRPRKEHILRYLKIKKKMGLVKDLHFIHWRLTSETRSDIRDFEYILYKHFHRVRDLANESRVSLGGSKAVVGIFYELLRFHNLNSAADCVHITDRERQVPVRIREIVLLAAEGL